MSAGVSGAEAMRAQVASHRILAHHRRGDLRHLLEVVGGAGGDRAEDDVLGTRPPSSTVM
jgi:hypothetical protein